MAPALGAGYRRFESSRPENKRAYSLSVGSFVFREDEIRGTRQAHCLVTKAARQGESSRPENKRAYSLSVGSFVFREDEIRGTRQAHCLVTKAARQGESSHEWLLAVFHFKFMLGDNEYRCFSFI